MVMETFLSVERACADVIPTYFAKDVVLILHNKNK
jgi:delta-aminolevulinic acid dehydratase/porphobilinogen synthase